MRIAAMATAALVWCMNVTLHAETKDSDRFVPEEHATFVSDRADGKFVSSRAIAHNLMLNRPPRLQYDSGMTPARFAAWRKDVAQTMARLMKHPATDGLEAPRLIESHRRDGYRIERWESYPLPDAVVPYLVLIPDGVDADHPAPGILCIPGWGQTKELLSGETSMDLGTSTVNQTNNSMALHYVKEGYVAVAVDNPACGEPDDLERLSGYGGAEYATFARQLLELDRSYLGYASYVDKVILEWMKTQPYMRSDRLVVSGFSFGTEPLMALGAMDPTIFAFVYNDFLCTTRERALTMTMPDERGRRPWPNDISHLIPGFLCEFDFPDIVASLAPRPVICTEGGMDRDFNLVHNAFATAGVPEAFTSHHYAMFADEADRDVLLSKMPDGVDRDTFFRLANVDPPHHYFKSEHVLPWLRKIFAE